MFNPLFKHSLRKNAVSNLRYSFQRFQHSATATVRTSAHQHPNSIFGTKLVFGTSVAILSFNSLVNPYYKSKILNETAYGTANRLENTVKSNVRKAESDLHGKSGFGGRVNYNELTIGSITGLFLGIIAGKLSSAIVFLTLSGYFLTQFLESRGIISIPWTQVIQVGSEKIDVKSLVLDKPAFKIPFVLSFLIAAYNI